MSKHSQSLPIPLAMLSSALLLSLFLFAACGTGAASPVRATPATVSTATSDTTVREKATPKAEMNGTTTPNAAGGFDCADVAQIPYPECAALVALYKSTNGPDWADNSGWLATNTPCTWSRIDCADGHVSHISLSYNQLTGPLPPALGNLVNLTQLYLSHNQLSGSIPVTFNNLSKLYELDLSYNQLIGSVPESVTHIAQRRLWGNHLTGTITANGQAPFTVDYEGIHFSADPSLATGIWPEVQSATPLPEVLDGPSYWLAIPEHIRFTFADPGLSPSRRRMGFNLAAEAQILVFPLAELTEINPLVQTQVETLRNLLAERGTVPAGELPLLPLTNSAQVFHAQGQYLGFGNIQGLRFISQHSQDPHPIMLSQELFYTFQGFTDGGAYYVAAFFPLTTAALPDTIEVEDWDAFHANYDTYLSATSSLLDELPTADFTPDLALLDAVVTSLRLEPDIALPGP